MKIGIYYDSLVSKGGAERVVIELANNLRADIITSGYNEEINKWLPINGKVVDLGNFSINYIKPIGTLFESPIRFYLNRNKFEYDCYIYCGFSSIYGSNIKNKEKNVWFCFTPNRILYDLKKIKMDNSSQFAKLILKLYILIFNKRDQRIIKNNFNEIYSQTENVKNRVKKYYQINSKVIYSPLDIKKYSFNKLGDYYLTVGRLFAEKRSILIVNSFLKMPDKKLIIVGDGPQKTKITKMIKKSNNIKILSNINEQKLKKLYSNCLATIYMPVNEDFGLVPLEGMASGKICIGVNEGGCLETIVNEKTGFLIKPQEKEIIRIINNFDTKKALKMKKDCLFWVKKFDIETIIYKWEQELSNLYRSKSKI